MSKPPLPPSSATIFAGRFEFTPPLGGTRYIYYRAAGRSGVSRHRIGYIRDRQFRRVTPEGWNARNMNGHHLSVIQSTAALRALRLGLIGPA